MASSWQKNHHPDPEYDQFYQYSQLTAVAGQRELVEEEQDQEDWLQLQLGLGLGLNSSSSNSINSSRLTRKEKHHQQHHHPHDQQILLKDYANSNQNYNYIANIAAAARAGASTSVMQQMSTRHITTNDHHGHVGPSFIDYPASSSSPAAPDHHHHDLHIGATTASFLQGVHEYDHSQSQSELHMALPSTSTRPTSVSLIHHNPSGLSTTKSGLWFTLRSSLNRELGEKGEALPQIQKPYIRVKEYENVTIFMVKKYLVRKLGLSNEAEIDIWCMGQNLKHTQTLKQVRDGVWLPRLVESVNSAAAAAAAASINFDDEQQRDFPSLSFSNHLMSLHYARR